VFRRTTSIVDHPRLVELFLWLVLVLQAELTSGGMPAAQPSDLLIRQGIEAVEKGAYQQAIRILTQAVGRSTASPVAVFYLAEAYIHLDQPGNAIPHYQRLIQSQPDAVQAHYGLAAAYRELEEYPLAVESYLSRLPNVTRVHDLHIWGMSTSEVALTAHLIIPGARVGDGFLQNVSSNLHDQFGINHTTLQVERGDGNRTCILEHPGSV